MRYSNIKNTGFTIVELLIVIVVIGILAAITVVAFNGIQDRARASKALSAFDAYEKALLMYKELNSSYPQTVLVSGTTYAMACLGEDYPARPGFNSGQCVTGTTSPNYHVDTSVNTALKSVMKTMPSVDDIGFMVAPTAGYRGLYYTFYPPSSALIAYYIKGDVGCGRGQKSLSSSNGETITVCTKVLPG